MIRRITIALLAFAAFVLFLIIDNAGPAAGTGAGADGPNVAQVEPFDSAAPHW